MSCHVPSLRGDGALAIKLERAISAIEDRFQSSIATDSSNLTSIFTPKFAHNTKKAIPRAADFPALKIKKSLSKAKANENTHKPSTATAISDDITTLTLKSSHRSLLVAVHKIITDIVLEQLVSDDAPIDKNDENDVPAFRNSDAFSLPMDLRRIFEDCSQLLFEVNDMQLESNNGDDVDDDDDALHAEESLVLAERIWTLYSRLREYGC